MHMSDPIADMLTRIRNAQRAAHPEVRLPASKEKAAIAGLLQTEGYLTAVAVAGDGAKKELVLGLKYEQKKPVITGLQRVSRPSCRVYVKAKDIPRVRGGLGLALISTSAGIVTGKEAKRRKLGGELLCCVW